MERNEVIGVYIKRIIMDEPNFFLSEPSIECYVIDKDTGTCIKGNSAESNIYLYKSPFTLTQVDVTQRSFLDNWNKLVVIEEKFEELKSKNKILMFEICKKVKGKKTFDFENKRIAWGFLLPVATDGSPNTNLELKLQLYDVKRNCKVSHQDCNVYHLYSDHKLKKLFGYLQILVKGVIPDKTKQKIREEAKTNNKSPEKQKILNESNALEKNISGKSNTKDSWSRLPSQSCRIPNKIFRTYNFGKNGASCVKFSRQGVYVASAVLYKIIIHEVLSGTEVIVLNSHIGFIYDLDWSMDDQYLLSVSNDCRGAIWSLHQKTPLYVLPHPSYVYCGKWFGSNERIVTGGRDHMLRIWSKNEAAFDLLEEIPGHSGFVSAIAIQDDSVVFSGDSHGCVMIRKFSNGCFELVKELSFSEISKNVVDSIHIHSSRRRIIVSIRSRGSYLVDVVSGVILQSYKSCIHAFVRLISSLSPCGSLLFSFRQNGDVGVWEVNTGQIIAVYNSLFPFYRVGDLSGCIHYHPHEHMIAIAGLEQNYPVILLNYDLSKHDDSEQIGLIFVDKKSETLSRF